MKYIDVSEHQGVVDFSAVRGSVDGVILRAGYGKGHADRQFQRSAAECSRLGIPCGAYWFSYAKSPDEARAEARHLLAAVRPYRMALPLAFDFEYDSVTNAAKQGVTVTKALASEMARAFLSAVEAGGYFAMLYANPDFLARYFDADLPRRYALWLADWRGAPDLTRPPRPDCTLWQWTSKGSVPGVAGCVDVSEAFTDFAALIRSAGINNLGAGEEEAEPPQSRPPASTAPPVGEPGTEGPLASPTGGGGTGEARDGEGLFSAAVAWALENGILPAGSAPEDAATLAAVAEMFLNYRRTFGGEA